MKKIFAIALALVMVLSMASAFAASPCYTWGKDWSCTVDADLCGKGSVEVIPYVKVNTSCGWEWQVSDCAAAIKTENVYWAIALTVDENPDPDWWAEATLEIETTGLTGTKISLAKTNFDEPEKAGVYYLAADRSEWIEVEDWEDLDTAREQEAYIFSAVVDELTVCNTDRFSVCATLESFYDGASVMAYNKLGDYRYYFGSFTGTDGFADLDEVEDAVPASYTGKLVVVEVDDDKEVNRVEFNVKEGAIVDANWDFDYKDNEQFYLDVMEDFGFAACGTAPCVTFENIQANFGWNDKVEDCFGWSEKGAAVVDAECVVAIPKTGDASVLAWLF